MNGPATTSTELSGKAPLIGALVLILFLLPGCAARSGVDMTGPSAAGVTRISMVELQNELDEFADRFAGVVTASANEIAAQSAERTTRRAALLWKLRVIPRLQEVIFGADPQPAFLDAAILTVQMRKYFQGPDTAGATLFADAQPVAVQASVRLEDDILRIGGLFLNAEQLQTLRDRIDKYTDAHPIRGTFLLTEGRATSTKDGQTPDLSWVAQIPLSPFRALEGIDAGARAISDFNITASQFAQIVEDMPVQTRWQIELLWYDLEESQSVVSTLQSFRALADSAASLSGTARQLPEQLREQLALAGKDLEDRQAALQTTLDQTRRTLESLNTAIDNATELTDAISQAGGSVANAGDAWREAVNAVSRITQSSDKPADAPAGKPFDIAEYTQAADKLTAAAAELRALLAETRETLESPQLGALSDAALKDAERRGRNVTDHAAWRVLQLLAVAFVLAIIYRLISNRLSKRGGSS